MCPKNIKIVLLIITKYLEDYKIFYFMDLIKIYVLVDLLEQYGIPTNTKPFHIFTPLYKATCKNIISYSEFEYVQLLSTKIATERSNVKVGALQL